VVRTLGALVGLVWLGVGTFPAGGDPVVLGGVDRYRVMDPLFECVRVVLAYRGEAYPPEYLQGLSGAAFRIAGPCPCAPTCSAAMGPQDLPRKLAYEAEWVKLPTDSRAASSAALPALLARVKDEIRAGRPVILWHAFTNAEWDVVCGFDEATDEFIGRGSYAGLGDFARAPQERTRTSWDICPPLGAVFIGARTGTPDLRELELSALEEAIHHCHFPVDEDLKQAGDEPLEWRFREGKPAYDAWVHGWRVKPDKTPDAGDRYCLGVYRSTHRAAAGFLGGIAARYPEAQGHFGLAARLFAEEAEALDTCYDDLCGGWEGWQQPDRAMGQRMAQLLLTARQRYGGAMKEVERGLRAIDPVRVKRAHVWK
jgi:hypothetical protein